MTARAGGEPTRAPDPTVAQLVRLELARLRALGEPFDVAFPAAVDTALASVPPLEAENRLGAHGEPLFCQDGGSGRMPTSAMEHLCDSLI